MAKTYRRFIRVGNETVASPRFNRKQDADEWYHQMRRKKQFLRDGLVAPKSKSDSIKFIDFSRDWLKKKIAAGYPKSTWSADDQRLRDYVLPHISEMNISDITTPQIKALLLKISEPGYLEEGFTISPATRTRVKALLSGIFSDALNEDPPLVSFNPVLGIKFKGKRTGMKKPRHLKSSEECLKFLAAAKEIGETEFLIASIFLMSGLRKQELIALRWKCFDEKSKILVIFEKYEQATGTIKAGTKGGENSTREVPIASELAQLLTKARAKSKYSGPDDFVVPKPNGDFYGARAISSMIEKIRAACGLDISAHGLRHTFGREFQANTGNLKALQAILGHSSSSTTDIYSDLAGDRIKGFNEAVSFSEKRSKKRSKKEL